MEGKLLGLAKAFRMKTIGVNRSGKKGVENIDELYLTEQMMDALPKGDFIVFLFYQVRLIQSIY